MTIRSLRRRLAAWIDPEMANRAALSFALEQTVRFNLQFSADMAKVYASNRQALAALAAEQAP